MYKFFLSSLVMLILTGCSFLHVHKMNIEQGNMLCPESFNQIHSGMTYEQVRNILGTPLLTNCFSQNNVEYIYTFKPGYGCYIYKALHLYFNNGILQNIQQI